VTKSTRNNIRERRERERVLQTILLEINKFLQVMKVGGRCKLRVKRGGFFQLMGLVIEHIINHKSEKKKNIDSNRQNTRRRNIISTKLR
jgi:hypothetical protein